VSKTLVFGTVTKPCLTGCPTSRGKVTAPGGSFSDTFKTFRGECEGLLVVQDVLKRGGGLDAMFDLFGALKESTVISPLW